MMTASDATERTARVAEALAAIDDAVAELDKARDRGADTFGARTRLAVLREQLTTAQERLVARAGA